MVYLFIIRQVKRVIKKMITKTLTNFEIIKIILGKLPEKYRNPKIIPLTAIHIALEWDFEKKYYVHLSLNTLHSVEMNYLEDGNVAWLSAEISPDDKDYDENVSVVVTNTISEKTTIKGFFSLSNESIEFLIKTFEEYDDKN